MKEIEAIRTALAAVPTPGPWIGAGPSHGKPLPEYLNSVVYDGEDGDENDWGDICNDTTHEDAVFIAACNPAAMAVVLAHIEEQDVEIERLRADAERYRWLRKQHWSKDDIAVVVNPKKQTRLGAICPSLGLLDDTIDHMRKETP